MVKFNLNRFILKVTRVEPNKFDLETGGIGVNKRNLAYLH